MPTIVQELGVDKKDYLKVGLLSMIPWTASVISMVYWGTHSDRTKERRWHSASGFLVKMVGLLILALVPHWPIASMFALNLVTIGWGTYVATLWSLPTEFLRSTADTAGVALINSVVNLAGFFVPDM